MWVLVKLLASGRHEVMRDERILRLSRELRIGYMYPYTPKCHNIGLEELRHMKFTPLQYYNLLAQKEYICVVLFVPGLLSASLFTLLLWHGVI